MNFANTQFNFTKKPLPRPMISRQLSREKSQPNLNPITPSTKFRISNPQIQKVVKPVGNFFSQHNDTTGSTKISKTLLKKPEIEFKQSLFDQEDREEELQFVLLCQTLEKLF